jgi:Subtilase family
MKGNAGIIWGCTLLLAAVTGCANRSGTQVAPVESEPRLPQTSDQGFSGDSTPDGPGAPDGLEEQILIRDYLDPVSGQTMRIVDGVVMVGFIDPPPPANVDANYFDVPISASDPVYAGTYYQIVGDPEIDAFIANEGLDVFAEWPVIASMAAKLPPGTTVEQAVSEWPVEYAGLVVAVEPDWLVPLNAWPQTDPNDDMFYTQWQLRESSAYDINIQQAWRNGYLGSPSATLAVIDTGIQRGSPDISSMATPHGANVTINPRTTTFALGGGYVKPSVYNDPHAIMAHTSGHGTCVAGIAAATINNDGNGVMDGRDVCGIAGACFHMPIAMDLVYDEETGPDFRNSTIVNAYCVIGIVKRVFWNFIGPGQWPYYNIEVANCSFGDDKPQSYYEDLLMDRLGNHILFVCSIGNDGLHGNQAVFPAGHPLAFSVGSYDTSGHVVLTYNYLDWTDILAPSFVLAPDMVGYNASGVYLGFSPEPFPWTGFNGTSASAPHVAAVATMVSAAYTALTPQQVRQRVITHAAHDLVDDYKDIGRIDAYAALGGL